MEVFDDRVSTADLKKFEEQYYTQHQRGSVSDQTKFVYASCLVRSEYSADVAKGIKLLEDLFHNGEEGGKRDYLYYLAIGHGRLKNYTESLRFLKAILQAEPNNRQATSLHDAIEKKMRSDGLKGLSIAGGAVVAVAAIAGLAVGLAKKK